MLRTQVTEKLETLSHTVSSEWVNQRLNDCIEKIRLMIPRLEGHFPSACTTNMAYRVIY